MFSKEIYHVFERHERTYCTCAQLLCVREQRREFRKFECSHRSGPPHSEVAIARSPKHTMYYICMPGPRLSQLKAFTHGQFVQQKSPVYTRPLNCLGSQAGFM